MNDLINLITQNGIGIVCVAYLIYFQATTMKSMLSTLQSISERLSIIEEHLDIKDKKGDRKKWNFLKKS